MRGLKSMFLKIAGFEFRYQVRQPIFTSAVGRWRTYERYLQPLIEGLGPYGPARQAA